MYDARKAKGSKDQPIAAQELRIDIIGTRIREIREVRSRSLAEIAQAAGIKPAFLEAVESGKKDPTMSELAKIAKGLAVPLPQLFSNLTPAAVVISATFKDAPEDIQDAVKTILTHPWVEA